MSKVIFLGTASSIPSKDRDNTSFLFIHKKHTLLIDCPGSISHKLLKAGVDFTKIKNVIITHEHIDHIYGIVSLIHTQAFLNEETVTIFSNPPSIRLIKKIIKLFKLDRKNYPKVKCINVFRKKYFIHKGDLRLEAVKNNHIKDSFGIKFIFGKKTCFYSSDTSFCPQMLKKAGDTNYLIHDCTATSAYFRKHPALYKMHTTSRMLASYLKSRPKTKLIPVHFLLLEKGQEKGIRKELAGIKNNLILARDLETLTL